MSDRNPAATNSRQTLNERERERAQSSRQQSNSAAPVSYHDSYSPQSALYSPHYTPPPSLSNLSAPYPSPIYRSMQSYGPNFPMHYSASPPMALSPYYYPYGQSPLGLPPQYTYQAAADPGPDASYPDPSRQQPLLPHHSPGPNTIATANPYSPLAYPAPGPYHPYPLGPPSMAGLAPTYHAGNPYPQIPQMDPGPEFWYTAGQRSPGDFESQIQPTLHRRPSDQGRLAGSSHTPRPHSPTIADPPDLARSDPPLSAGSGSEQQSPAVDSESRLLRPGAQMASRRSDRAHPPTSRSEWVMWVGNIPSDCTHAELVAFFESVLWPPPSPSSSSASGRAESHEVSGHGVISVFLISQSNCAFVNYDSERKLQNAVSQCNGRAIRPEDPRCLKLVCRVRKKDEDLRAGVGAQRGARMHTAWVQQQKALAKQAGQIDAPYASLPATVPTPMSTGPLPSSPQEHTNTSPTGPARDGSSGSVSFVSTNSSFLANNFPQRYFILKSLTQEDLNLSVERGLWATQPHNEMILDQAWRSSKDVFLIFGANKTGEFFGYARMAGPILKDESRAISWTSRSDLGTQQPNQAGPSGTTPDGASGPGNSPTLAKATRFLPTLAEQPLRDSPLPVTPSPFASMRPQPRPHFASAPPEMTEPFKRISKDASQIHAGTLDDRLAFRLDESVPLRAMRSSLADRIDSAPSSVPALEHRESLSQPSGGASASVLSNTRSTRPGAHVFPQNSTSEPEMGRLGPRTTARIDWGTPFPVTWHRVQPLPFTRTRHIRNPWNAGREVKVSRDGTELEPEVGRLLLAEWDNLPPATPPPAQPKKATNPRGVSGRR